MTNEQQNQWTGRTARHIALVVGVCIICLTTLAMFGFVLLVLFKLCPDRVLPIYLIIFSIIFTVGFMALIQTLIGLVIANDNIFCSSGIPQIMAQSLYESFFLQSQFLLALVVSAIVVVLLINGTLKPSEGLPVLTGAVGFALGRQFRKSDSEKLDGKT